MYPARRLHHLRGVPSETTTTGFEFSAGPPPDGTSSAPALSSAPVVEPEEWRAVPGFLDLWEVSSLGGYRSWVLRRGHLVLVRCAPIEIAQITDGDGYKQVYIKRTPCGRGRMERVHVLVALAFLGPRPAGMMVRHLDGNKWNNAALNLRYGTAHENQNDRGVVGYSGRSLPLSNEMVLVVRTLSSSGSTAAEISRSTGAAESTVRAILKGRRRSVIA